MGSAIAARRNPIHTAGDVAGNVHAAISVSTAAGADNVRRRLSSIFQRPITGIGARKIHGSSCQSPRAHRCWRAAATP